MVNIFLVAAVLIAIADWIAVAKSWRTLEYLTKPGMIVALMIWVGFFTKLQGPMLWFFLGLLSSLAGDIFLLKPDHYFSAGFIAFLLTHIFYIIGLNSGTIIINLPVVILAVIIFIVDLQVYPRLVKGCDSSGQQKYRFPIFIYMSIISLMLLSALTTLVRPEWQISHAFFVSAGAILFFFSDLQLGCQRFVSSIAKRRLLVIIPYQIGQLAIIIGATFHTIH